MGDGFRIIWLLAIGLGLACIFGYLAQRYKQPTTIGYLAAGYLIGPNSAGFVADPYISDQLANLGVTLLMFAVGLSFNWKDLIAVKRLVVPGALILATISFFSGLLFIYYMEGLVLAGFVVGFAICVSSTVVIVRVLSDAGILHTKLGHIVVGWTIVEDIISVSGLLLLPSFVSIYTFAGESGADAVLAVVILLAKISIFGIIVYFFGGRLVESALKIVARRRSHELFTLAILSITFLIAVGSSQLFGVSVALGAFIAGTIVGRTDMSYQAAANALPMRDAFSVIFFLSVGMLFNPSSVVNNLALFSGIVFILVALRPLLAFLIVRVARYPFSTAITTAFAIAQIGEYSFILAEEGSGLGVLPNNVYDVLIAVAFFTIALNPLLFKLLPYIINSNERHHPPGELSIEQLNAPKYDNTSFLPRAVVIGFGPVGRMSTKEISEKGYGVTVIDHNIDSITLLKNTHIDTIFGDATQFHILENAQLENASLIVITLPEFQAVRKVIRIARNMNPHIKIIARVRFNSDLSDVSLNAVSTVCDENASAEELRQLLAAKVEFVGAL